MYRAGFGFTTTTPDSSLVDWSTIDWSSPVFNPFGPSQPPYMGGSPGAVSPSGQERGWDPKTIVTLLGAFLIFAILAKRGT